METTRNSREIIFLYMAGTSIDSAEKLSVEKHANKLLQRKIQKTAERWADFQILQLNSGFRVINFNQDTVLSCMLYVLSCALLLVFSGLK